MSKQLYTFWGLINECRIEVPVIQRDYTYGRKHAQGLSKKLVNSIFNAVVAEKPIHLDFVYGDKTGIENVTLLERNRTSINTLLQSLKSYADNLNIDITYDTKEKHKDSSEIICFVPLDGQQRLTTLFLIHWFLFNFLEIYESKTIFSRFSYATRSSSNEFIRLLCNDTCWFKVSEEIKVTDSIQNNEAFYTSWKKDPTVSSMLIVLDLIQEIFYKNRLQDNVLAAWQILTETDTVVFDFFELQDFELTDELYVKMNARGKSLTPFENFKSWLMKDNSTITISKWKTKLDIAWNDIFWQRKDVGETKIDDQYLQFFKNMFLGDYLLSRNNTKPGDYLIAKDENIDELRQNVKYNPIPLFETEDVFAKNIDSYLYILQAFEDGMDGIYYNERFIEKPVSSLLFKNNIGLNWWDTTYYFALTRYIIYNDDLQYLDQWSRVISNLIYNTPIESPKLYTDACESIIQLLKVISGNNVYEEIARLSPGSIDFFAEKQKEEEIQKSKLIVAHPAEKWEDLFSELENHEYFYGQIGFIFSISKSSTFKDFSDTSKKISALFSKPVLDDSSYVLFRCLLTFRNCFIESNSNLIYPSNARGTLRNRNENWRRFFDIHSDAIKLLINHKIYDDKDSLLSLRAIIKAEKGNVVGCFYNKLINNSRLFDYPKQNVLRNYDKNYYLLNSSRIFGYFVELETYDWFLKNQQGNKLIPGFKISYEPVKGRDNEPGLILTKGRSKKYLYRNHLTGKYYFYKSKPEIEYNTIEKAIKTLIK